MHQCGDKGAASSGGFGMKHRRGTASIMMHNPRAKGGRHDGVSSEGSKASTKGGASAGGKKYD